MKKQKIRFGIVGTGTIAHRFANAMSATQSLLQLPQEQKKMPKNSAMNSIFPFVSTAMKKWHNPMLSMPHILQYRTQVTSDVHAS